MQWVVINSVSWIPDKRKRKRNGEPVLRRVTWHRMILKGVDGFYGYQEYRLVIVKGRYSLSKTPTPPRPAWIARGDVMVPNNGPRPVPPIRFGLEDAALPWTKKDDRSTGAPPLPTMSKAEVYQWLRHRVPDPDKALHALHTDAPIPGAELREAA